MSTRDKLLSALDRPVGTRLSGETLAAELGVTRAMVWKYVRTLRELGVPIQSDSRTGYQVAGPIDPSLLQWRPPTGLARSFTPHHFWSTPSTQRLARGGAESGLPEGHLWLAERQTAGKGRLGRTWDSGYGGLWFSLLLRPPVPSAQAPSVTQVAALALTQVLNRIVSINAAGSRPTACRDDDSRKSVARIKWPNDIGIATKDGWRKLAGILTEMSGEVDRTHWVVMGIGLNVNNHLPSNLRSTGTTLAQITGRAWRRGEILSLFCQTFEPLYRRWVKEGFVPFREAFWKQHREFAGPVNLKTAQGLIRGTASGVDDSGALIVKSRREIHHLLEGEIIS